MKQEISLATTVQKDVLIIGGGPAGLAVAVALKQQGVHDLLIVEREHRPGGILRQCIHDGFGLTRFRESLSGPEYADRFITAAASSSVDILTDAMAVDLTGERVCTVLSKSGRVEIAARAVVLAMGCRERTRGAIGIPGSRPAGVYTAGVAQAYANMENILVGREIVLMGSGDIGLIMARRLTLEGAHVKGVYEILPYPGGLPRNIEQCLNDYGIPLHLNHTVTQIHGKTRLTGVTVNRVDERRLPIPGSETLVPCDTLILSVGLIPENELSQAAGVLLDPKTQGALVDEHYQTSVPGIFSAGNVLHVHDLVDYVSLEGEALAGHVARYLEEGRLPDCPLSTRGSDDIAQLTPQRISGQADVHLSLRVRRPFHRAALVVTQAGRTVETRKFQKLLPAEMAWLKLSRSTLRPTGHLAVDVICEETI